MYRAIFAYGPLAAWALLLIVVVHPLRLKAPGRIALSLVLLALTQKFLIYQLLGGDALVPDLPERFINVTGWLYSSCMILCALACAWTVVCGAWRLCLHRAAPCAVIPALAVVALLTAGWGVWEGVRVPDVKRIELPVKGLPAAFDGFRLVQISDIHCSSAARRARTAGIVAAVNALDADLVCLTGDLVDGSPTERADDLAPLADLRARYGVASCTGNHEKYSIYKAWRPVFDALHLGMLDNDARVIEKGGAALAIGGVLEWRPNVAQAFTNVPPAACRILLKHRPFPPATNAQDRVALQLSGHTHGGMMPVLDRIVARLGNGGFVRGLYRLGDFTLYVNPGTGQWAGFPLRLGVPAEITLFTLRRVN